MPRVRAAFGADCRSTPLCFPPETAGDGAARRRLVPREESAGRDGGRVTAPAIGSGRVTSPSRSCAPRPTGDPKAHAYFAREAELVSRLTHPNIVRTHGKLEIDGRLLIAMERLQGRTLEAAFEQQPGPWSEEAAVRLIGGVAAGLAYAHAAKPQLVHRDIKPSNIFLEDSGGMKILDFGIGPTSSASSLRTSQSGPPGTPLYMPPEVLLGSPSTPASDVSLGLVFFRLLAGKLPCSVPENVSPWVLVSALVRAYSRDLPLVSTVRPGILAPDREARRADARHPSHVAPAHRGGGRGGRGGAAQACRRGASEEQRCPPPPWVWVGSIDPSPSRRLLRLLLRRTA